MIGHLQKTEALFPTLPAPEEDFKDYSTLHSDTKYFLWQTQAFLWTWHAFAGVCVCPWYLACTHMKVGNRNGNKYETWYQPGKPGPLQLFKQFLLEMHLLCFKYLLFPFCSPSLHPVQDGTWVWSNSMRHPYDIGGGGVQIHTVSLLHSLYPSCLHSNRHSQF